MRGSRAKALALGACLLLVTGSAAPPPRHTPLPRAAAATTDEPFARRIEDSRRTITAALVEVCRSAPAACRARVALDGTNEAAQVATALRAMLLPGRRFLAVDPAANDHRASWVELVGELGPRTRAVGILVPGTSAYATSENINVYRDRALSFVAASGGELAMIVWAGGQFPGGNLEAVLTSYDAPLASRLAAFSHELRAAVGPGVPVTAIGHSYGGAVVGEAELYGLDADRVLHLASAGVGADVDSTQDYPVPDRPRYSMTAPGDLIGYLQGLSLPFGLGHGADPDELPGIRRLGTGGLHGIGAHSEIFTPGSVTWRNTYGVLRGDLT